MADKRRNITSLISDVSSDIQPIKRGAGLGGLIGGQQLHIGESRERVDEAAQPQSPPAENDEHAAATPAPRVERPQSLSTPATQRERRARATGEPASTGAQRRAPVTPPARTTLRANETARGRDAAPKSVTRQNKTFRLLPEPARDIAVEAATRSVFEYSLIEEAIERFLAKRAAPVVTRPRDNAELARRVRKSYSLRTDIVRDIAVMSATWDVFEYEIVEEALKQYLELDTRSV